MGVRYPIMLRDGGLADVWLSRGADGGRVVRITIPKKAAYVDILAENPIVWGDVDLTEIWLPEDVFSAKVLGRL